MKTKTRTILLLALALQLLLTKGNLGSRPITWRVDLPQGSIEGQRMTVNGGRGYFAFRGIPFARPPLGPYRFKNPEPPTSWNGVRNGSFVAPPCAQVDRASAAQGVIKLLGSEDCLYLNVFSPGNAYNYPNKLPVMVYIHGGSFYELDARPYEPNHLLQKDVVVVVMQYRLNIFGFLTTEDSILPGNLGLKDMVMALQWVKRNIKHFSGDPNSVTLFGQSAGGMSTHLLMFLPAAKGLFHRAIAQSGLVMTPVLHRDDHKKSAAILGQKLQCSGVSQMALDSQALYDCLLPLSTETLINATASFTVFEGTPLVFLLWVDGDFIPEHPVVLVRDGKYQGDIDFMTGITKDEGGLQVRGFLQNNAVLQAIANNFSINIPLYLGIENEEFGVYVAKRLFFGYLGDIAISEENADAAVKMITDYMFAVPMDVTAQARFRNKRSRGKTYLYEFHHRGEFSLFDSPNLNVGKNWVAHLDDVQYLFSSGFFGIVRSPIDLFMSEITVSLWTNFAKTGNPTPDLSLGFKWPAISRKELRYMILQPSPYVRGFNREREVKFMTNLPLTINELMFPNRFN